MNIELEQVNIERMKYVLTLIKRLNKRRSVNFVYMKEAEMILLDAIAYAEDAFNGRTPIAGPEIQNDLKPESISLRAYFMANIRPPFNMSDAWVDELAGPLRKDELGTCATIEESILQFANAEAEYRRILADAMIKALTK